MKCVAGLARTEEGHYRRLRCFLALIRRARLVILRRLPRAISTSAYGLGDAFCLVLPWGASPTPFTTALAPPAVFNENFKLVSHLLFSSFMSVYVATPLRCHTATNSARASAFAGDIRIFSCKFVSMFAVRKCAPSSCRDRWQQPSHDVFAARNRLKMLRFDTTSNSALVI